MNVRSCFNATIAAALVAGSLSLATPGRAQTVILPLPSTAVPRPRGLAGSSESVTPALSSIASALASDLPLYRRGPIALRPHALYRVLHGSGIEAGPGEHLATTTHTLAPGLLVEAGAHWRFDYTPVWTYYSNGAFKDSVDHAADAAGAYTYDEWTFGLFGNYGSGHPVLVETARQSHEVRYGLGAQASCQLGPTTYLDLAFNHSVREASSVIDAPEWTPANSREWSSTDGLRRQISSRVGLSAGLTFGYADPSIGPAMTFLQPQVSATWTPTDAVSINVEAGLEKRRFHSSDAHDLDSPIYSAGLRYRPVAATTVLVDVTRGVSVSYLADAVTRSYGWRAGLEQRLFELMYLTASFSRRNTSYLLAASTLPAVRDDRYDSLEAKIAVPVLRRGSISIFYLRSKNASTLAGYAFVSRQYGAEIGFRF